MISFTKHCILKPQENIPWAQKMVLNPAMIADPENKDVLYMLSRTTGPGTDAQLPEHPLPYPIYLGFAESRDRGQSWDFDWSTPAMSPRLDYNKDDFIKNSFRNGRMFDYANGCIEDPRLFVFEDDIYMTIACRAFPPGPYWEKDDPVQCMPAWAADEPEFFGKAVCENRTVSMLYKVNIRALAARDYHHAFEIISPLHSPDISDNRDVVLFPRRLKINGKEKIVCLHRPKEPWCYECGKNLTAPSIFIACADNFDDFYNGTAENHVLAVPEFEWEANRIGCSWAPVELTGGEWLMPYHGKQDDVVGYTQSFMLLKERENGFPAIISRPPARTLFASEPWELEGDFTIPCLFTCSGVILENKRLLMGYGAADRVLGIAECDFEELKKYIFSFAELV